MCAPVCQYCWIVTSLCWLYNFGSFPTHSQHSQSRRALLMSRSSKKVNASIILYYVNEKSGQRFASWLCVELKNVIFSHLYWHKSLTYWQPPMIYHHFLLSQKGKKRGKEKADPTSLYTHKYSAENKPDLQCLTSLYFSSPNFITRHWTILIEAYFAALDFLCEMCKWGDQINSKSTGN